MKWSLPPASATLPMSVGYFNCAMSTWPDLSGNTYPNLLKRHGGDVRAAARKRKLPRGTLYRLMKNHALDGDAFRQ